MKKALGVVAVGLAGLASFGLSGCDITNIYGVNIQNQTGQNLMVEFLNVSSDGSTKVYSTARLAPKGTFANSMTPEQQGFGKRVRFSLPDRPAEDTGATLELKLSEDSSRYYNLTLKNGRLMAQEYAKTQLPDSKSALVGGDER